MRGCIIVDEILSVGDMRFQAKCFNKFKEFREKGVTILYVGHDVGMMRTFCDKAMWINKGKLVDIGDPTFISAKYTEFMYLDNIAEFTDYKLLKKAEAEENEIVGTMEVEEEPHKQEQKINNSLFPDSIAHWGSRHGMIQYVKVYNQNGEEKKYFSIYDKMKIVIGFDVYNDIDMNIFSVAVSIKNKEGTDIFVKTTYDEGVKIINGKGQKVAFEFVPRLANGDYYLVLAIENRENASISYFEYVEGAFYFKMYTNKKIYGMVDLETSVNYNSENVKKE